MLDIDKLRFPIGKYNPEHISIDDIEKWMEDIRDFPILLKKALEGYTEESLNYTYRPEGWTIRQVVHHCADSHLNAYMRFKLALTENNPTIKPYNEGDWGRMKEVFDSDIQYSLLILEGLHARWFNTLTNMSVTDFARTFFHPELKKTIDLSYTIGMYAWHCRHHLGHIENAIALRKAHWN